MVIDKEISTWKILLWISFLWDSDQWPPFLELRHAKMHNLAWRNNVLVNKMSLMMTFHQDACSELKGKRRLNRWHISDNGRTISELMFPALKSIAHPGNNLLSMPPSELLLCVEPIARRVERKNPEAQLFQWVSGLSGATWKTYKFAQLLKNYSFRQNGHLDIKGLNDCLYLAWKRRTLETEIVMMQETIFWSRAHCRMLCKTGISLLMRSSPYVERW